ncbi:MAG: 16S rRNA (adenine(1518)-N(6)/adenine(1519)-N(6))-dimethyltransferase RsmA [Pseudomonadota bacterium]
MPADRAPRPGGTPDGLPPLREVIAEHGLSARKSLGQNFLLDLNVTRKIARAAGPPKVAVEVGPGPGGLTRALLIEGAGQVIAIERDPRCLPALEAIAARWPGRLTVVEGDALKANFADLTAEREGAEVVANLPYNVGTELLIRWLRGAPDAWPSWWRGLTLMFQREVAERIVAQPGDKAYGRLAVLARWRSEPRLLFELPPQAFTPPPKVTSAVVRITPLDRPRHPARLESLERVTAAAFTQRRKMLRASLKSLGVDPLALLAEVGVDPTARAETIDLAGFCAIAQAYDRLRGLAALDAG